MRSRRIVAAVAAAAALALLPAACARKAEPPASAGAGKPVIGLVFDVGGRGDKSFNDQAYAGLERAQKELGITFRTLETGEGADREAAMRQLAAGDAGLIFGVGFLFSEDIAKSATESPDTTFAVIDGFADSCTQPDSNLLCIGFKEQEGSFLVGAAAALKTKSNTVGFVGGLEGDLIRKFQAGYEAGVKYIADRDGKSIKVLVDYAGNTPEAFRNPAKGKELALKQIGQGADVLYHAAGATGNGMIDECAAQHKFAIGVDSDQSLTTQNPANREWILTSMLKRVDNAVTQTIASFVSGSLKGGIQTLGLKEGGIDYAKNDFNTELLGDIPTTLDELKQKIISGEITVPSKPS